MSFSFKLKGDSPKKVNNNASFGTMPTIPQKVESLEARLDDIYNYFNRISTKLAINQAKSLDMVDIDNL